jgi:NDP-sugar pyrophosphorylase family protein
METCVRVAREVGVLKLAGFIDVEGFEHKALFDDCDYYWEVIARLPQYLSSAIYPCIMGHVHPMTDISGAVFIDEGSIIEIGTKIVGPVHIGKNCRIRAGSYLHGNVIMGDDVDFGHTCNAYSSVILNKTTIFPMCFIGASVIGGNTYLQAGCVLSGLTLSRDEIVVRVSGEIFNTAMRNLGAIVGHDTQLGGRVTTTPGTMIGPRSVIQDNAFLSGFYGPKTVIRTERQR